MILYMINYKVSFEQEFNNNVVTTTDLQSKNSIIQ